MERVDDEGAAGLKHRGHVAHATTPHRAVAGDRVDAEARDDKIVERRAHGPERLTQPGVAHVQSAYHLPCMGFALRDAFIAGARVSFTSEYVAGESLPFRRAFIRAQPLA